MFSPKLSTLFQVAELVAPELLEATRLVQQQAMSADSINIIADKYHPQVLRLAKTALSAILSETGTRSEEEIHSISRFFSLGPVAVQQYKTVWRKYQDLHPECALVHSYQPKSPADKKAHEKRAEEHKQRHDQLEAQLKFVVLCIPLPLGMKVPPVEELDD